MYYNSIVHDNFYRDSLFIEFVSNSPFSEQIKENLFLNRMQEVERISRSNLFSYKSSVYLKTIPIKRIT